MRVYASCSLYFSNQVIYTRIYRVAEIIPKKKDRYGISMCQNVNKSSLGDDWYCRSGGISYQFSIFDFDLNSNLIPDDTPVVSFHC